MERRGVEGREILVLKISMVEGLKDRLRSVERNVAKAKTNSSKAYLIQERINCLTFRVFSIFIICYIILLMFEVPGYVNCFRASSQ